MLGKIHWMWSYFLCKTRVCTGHTQVRILDLILAKGLLLAINFLVLVLQQPETKLTECTTKALNKSCTNLPLIVLIVCFWRIIRQIKLTDHKDWHLLLHIMLQNPQSVSSLPTSSTEGWIWPLAGVGVLENTRLHLMQAYFEAIPITRPDY